MDLLAHCQAENERLRKLVEPKEWLGWEQVDSIYDEAALLRKERDDARQQLRGAVEKNEALRWLYEEATGRKVSAADYRRAIEARSTTTGGQ